MDPCLPRFLSLASFVQVVSLGRWRVFPSSSLCFSAWFCICVSHPLDTCVPGFIPGALQYVPPVCLKSLCFRSSYPVSFLGLVPLVSAPPGSRAPCLTDFAFTLAPDSS